MVGRIPVIEVHPVIERGEHSAKAALGRPFTVRATIVREGHDALNADTVFIGPDGKERPPVRMKALEHEVDRWSASFVPDVEGPWAFRVEGWSDPIETWRHNAEIKIPAGIDTELMFAEGKLVFERVLSAIGKGRRKIDAADRAAVKALLEALGDTRRPEAARLAPALHGDIDEVLARHPVRDFVSAAGPFPFFVDRPLAVDGAWYEFFPRSEGATVDPETGRVTTGTFKTACQRLAAVADMGFDVVYLPPIHPIGTTFRKGPNNTLACGPDDVGSPWAIGSPEGGHDAVHPDLGTEADFAEFVKRANALGLEVALDIALQASPDHPWVSKHPEWFTTRADGSIAYAENPPKKYQDIYPVNFDNDPEGIYAEVLRILRHWMDLGVRVFRVDNPHTKPVAFWERLLAEVRASDPDVIFLSEAFTRPAMMHLLGKIGFHQSYTYFTWRNAKTEIEDYLTEVSRHTSHFLRPNFFVNTPDILHEFLQYGGPAAFKIRSALAATSSPSWGMYAGFELFEHVAVRPGSEEYLDSEKYQLRPRDWEAAEREGRSLAPYVRLLNGWRKEHPALGQLDNLTVHRTTDDHTVAFSKRAAGDGTTDDDIVIVVINLDPHATREGMVHLDMSALGMHWSDRFVVEDAVTGESWTWGADNYVRLDPSEPAHLLTVRPTP
jgi:starch synthase (maltosyl-transferring)